MTREVDRIAANAALGLSANLEETRMLLDEIDRCHVRRITHGRHCTCSSCACEDWTSPELAPCGMHGESCAGMYQPYGRAGTPFPLVREGEQR